MPQSFTPWAGANGQAPGTSDASLSGGPQPSFRGGKDQRLAMWNVTPEAKYPDGYLGTQPATTRRADKLVDSVYRKNTRPYTRGVHKGERINPGDYLWPDEFNPMTGLERQVAGVKFAPTGAVPVVLTNDGKSGGTLERPEMEVIDMERRSRLKSLAPGWR